MLSFLLISKNFKYSSLEDFSGVFRKETKIINRNSFPEDFKFNHIDELFELYSFSQQEIDYWNARLLIVQINLLKLRLI
jgi:hypothetical protein